ncbi:hypothetical protein AB0M46_49155 [Dactylosporangium sp. NPDC051485]|uniref:hypothetical protein n=1 Tax=Dactylosporangium sp. NPDC051485 TaxID=3154846 RepID=UPI00341BB50A
MRIANALIEGTLAEATSPRTRNDLARKARQRQHVRAGRNTKSGAATPPPTAPATA